MDDEDARWLGAFNAKAEGTSGEGSPVREKENIPLSAGRERRTKGKDKEKEANVPATLNITDDTFEYIMGVLEKHAEDSVPMLHTVSRDDVFLSYTCYFAEPCEEPVATPHLFVC
jgi:enhancer of polycomb-like protein